MEMKKDSCYFFGFVLTLLITVIVNCPAQLLEFEHQEALYPETMTQEEHESVIHFKENLDTYRRMFKKGSAEIEMASMQGVSSDPRQPAIRKVVLGPNSALYLTNPIYGDAKLVYSVTNVGESSIGYLRFYHLVPFYMPRQQILDIEYFPSATPNFVTDNRGQLIAEYNATNVAPGVNITAGWRARVVTWDSYYDIDPNDVGPLSEISPAMKAEYVDKHESIYQKNHSIVTAARDEALQGETRPYYMAQSIIAWMRSNIAYLMEGGWDDAPVVIARGNGSCSEWTYAFVAICRSAGIPARWSGSAVRRGSENGPGPYMDTAHHRWGDFYLPRIGWIECNGDMETLGNRFLITSKSSGSSNYTGVAYTCTYKRSGGTRERSRFAEWYSDRNYNYKLGTRNTPYTWPVMGYIPVTWSIMRGYEEENTTLTLELSRMGRIYWKQTGLLPDVGEASIPIGQLPNVYGPQFTIKLYREDNEKLYGAIFPVEIKLDSDLDDMDDRWENKYFGSLSANKYDDPDGDGCRNFSEYNGLTHPLRANSFASDIAEVSSEVGLGNLGHNTYGYNSDTGLVRANETVWDKALGAHAFSRVQYLVPDNARAFQSLMSMDDNGNGKVAYQVYVNDQMAYTGGTIKKYSTSYPDQYPADPVMVSVPVKGGDKIELVVDSLSSQSSDYSCWLSPSFVYLPEERKNWLLFELSQNWKTEETSFIRSVDLVRDNVIDEKDLLYLIKHWTD
jgi:Transglutaminase-like superfamily/NPCBM/NEW2 domain